MLEEALFSLDLVRLGLSWPLKHRPRRYRKALRTVHECPHRKSLPMYVKHHPWNRPATVHSILAPALHHEPPMTSQLAQHVYVTLHAAIRLH